MSSENTNKPSSKTTSRFIPSSINTRFTWTGHALKWSWEFDGSTTRTPDRIVSYRGWNKNIWYHWKGSSTIVLNKYVMEITLRSRKFAQTKRSLAVTRMIYTKWAQADMIAREFSQYAQIAIKPIHTEHPADIGKAHLVMMTKALNPILKPMSAVKDDVGLIFDESHPNLPELAGRKSVEGGQGAEWFFTKFPKIVQHQIEMDDRFATNLAMHLKVLQEIRDAIKELKEVKKL